MFDAAATGSVERYVAYDANLQQRLEAAYERDKEGACVEFSHNEVDYVIKFAEVVARDSATGAKVKSFDSAWVQLRAEDNTKWRAVQRQRVLEKAEPSSLPPAAAHGGSEHIVASFSAPHHIIHFQHEPGAPHIGALTGFTHIAGLASAELLQRCLKELPGEDAPSRSSRPQYQQPQLVRRPAVWDEETAPDHRDFHSFVTIPRASHEAWARSRLESMGGFFNGGGEFHPVPPPWLELEQLLRKSLCLHGVDGEQCTLLDDMLLLHCQASRVRPGGHINPHVDKAAYGEIICAVLLQGASTVRIWAQSSLEVNQDLVEGDAYCLFGKARSHQDAGSGRWRHGIAYRGGREARLSLVFRFASRSAFFVPRFPMFLNGR